MLDQFVSSAGNSIETNPWLAILAVFLVVGLSITFLAGSGASVSYGGFLLLVYALGHSVLILIAGTSMGAAKKLIESKKLTKATDVMRRVAGGVIVLVGAYFAYRGIA